MYSLEQLEKYDYFKNLLKTNKLDYVLDSLTGVISRRYILEFVKELIKNDIHFTMAIVDLDYFKDINDNYGHVIGDYILEAFATDLSTFVGEKGLVGRYGGDEFMIVVFGMNDYDHIHLFYESIFKKNVLRKHYNYLDKDIFLTGTIGSAAYPDDAKDYDGLFAISDKTLYRGKIKGRNCYIIYVPEKHRNLKIEKLHNDDLATIIFNINAVFESHSSFDQKLTEISAYIKDNLMLDKIYYIDLNKNFYDMETMELLARDIDLDSIKFSNDLYKRDYAGEVNKMSFGPAIKDDKLASVLITKIFPNNNDRGYLVFGLHRAEMIWQNKEIAILLYLAKAIALELANKK